MDDSIYRELAISASEHDRYFFGFLVASLIIFVVVIARKEFERKFVNYLVYLILIFFTTLCIFTYSWETDRVEVSGIHYSHITRNHTVNVEIKLKIGLRGFNVTMRGIPETQLNEKIRYNENFSWSDPRWRHRTLENDYSRSVERGTPLPILHLAEYMILDAEYIRWGREYRIAGYYNYTFLWLAFSLNMLSAVYYTILKSPNKCWNSTASFECFCFYRSCVLDDSKTIRFGNSLWFQCSADSENWIFFCNGYFYIFDLCDS